MPFVLGWLNFIHKVWKITAFSCYGISASVFPYNVFFLQTVLSCPSHDEITPEQMSYIIFTCVLLVFEGCSCIKICHSNQKWPTSSEEISSKMNLLFQQPESFWPPRHLWYTVKFHFTVQCSLKMHIPLSEMHHYRIDILFWMVLSGLSPGSLGFGAFY